MFDVLYCVSFTHGRATAEIETNFIVTTFLIILVRFVSSQRLFIGNSSMLTNLQYINKDEQRFFLLKSNVRSTQRIGM